jgi:hypothetical protein
VQRRVHRVGAAGLERLPADADRQPIGKQAAILDLARKAPLLIKAAPGRRAASAAASGALA